MLIFLLIPSMASAGVWIRTGTFDAGYYVVCGVMEDGSPFCVNAIADGTISEAKNALDTLNDDPITLPKDAPIWFKWDAAAQNLKKVVVPFKYIDGDMM